MIILRLLAIFLFILKNYALLSVAALVKSGIPIIAGMGFLLASKRFYLRAIPTAYFTVLALFFINLFIGFFVYNPLLKLTGKAGTAVIINTAETNIQNNDNPVTHFDVRIKLNDSSGTIVSAGFDSDAYNIVPYPDGGHYYYPPVGAAFNVRYAPEFPGAFVIIADDDSAYSQQLRCAEEAKAIGRLQAALALEPNNKTYLSEIADRKQSRCFRQ